MAFVPDDAMRQRRRDKLTPAAWELYGYYCAYRSKRTGYAFPSDQLLFEEFGIPLGTTQNARTELKNKDWLAQTADGVFLLVGDFSPVTQGALPTPPEGKKYVRAARSNSRNQEIEIPESRNLNGEIPESRNSNSRNQEFLYKGVTSQVNQQEETAATAPAREEDFSTDDVTNNRFALEFMLRLGLTGRNELNLHQRALFADTERELRNEYGAQEAERSYEVALKIWAGNNYAEHHRQRKPADFCDRWRNEAREPRVTPKTTRKGRPTSEPTRISFTTGSSDGDC